VTAARQGDDPRAQEGVDVGGKPGEAPGGEVHAGGGARKGPKIVQVETRILSVAALSVLSILSARAEGARKVEFEWIAGGDAVYPVHDSLTLAEDGTVTFTTPSPIDAADGAQWRTQNRIGTFSYRAGPGEYRKFADALTAGLRSKGGRPDANKMRSGYDVLHWEGDDLSNSIIRVWSGQQATIDQVMPDALRLKAEALKHPVRAAELSCSLKLDTIACSVRNLGHAPVNAPNPDTAAFFCTDRERHVVPVSARPKNANPSGPKEVTIQASKSVEFKFQPLPREKCDYHIVMKGSNPFEPWVLISNEVAAAKF
jgi:hypothetical protein